MIQPIAISVRIRVRVTAEKEAMTVPTVLFRVAPSLWPLAPHALRFLICPNMS